MDSKAKDVNQLLDEINVLGVPVWHYLPYAIFCYMSLVLTLVFGWTGVTLSRVEPKK